MKTNLFSLLFTCGMLMLQPASHAQGDGVERALIQDFWMAASAEAQTLEIERLNAADVSVQSLFALLKRGPVFPSDAPRGLLENHRVAADGTVFPYVLLVPDAYTPAQSWPVEFNLHGGISRPYPAPGETWWRQGYEALQEEDRIVVVPAAWHEAFWWFDNQADNLPAILRRIKQAYRVDDNRVTLSGVSDGGTGAYFFAFLQATEWAAFMPYIGHPAVLRNPAARATHSLSFENLKSKPLYIVNGENDPLYPATAVQSYVDLMVRAGVEHVFRIIPEGGHNTRWLPAERPAIERFRQNSVRDPLPDQIEWVTNRTDRYNRNHWLRIDSLQTEGQPGRVIVARQDNTFEVTAFGVRRFTLLLNPEELDMSRAITVRINGTEVFQDVVPERKETLLQWATQDRDRSMLFTAELSLQVPAQ
jgi:poly(3-hydroxybutyrate) depolymerase